MTRMGNSKSMSRWNGTTWLRIALTAWIVLAVAASVKTVIEPRAHTVYTAFSHGCRDWWDGNSLYVDRAYYYSPTFAILMTPFAIWSDRFGGVLWNFASVGLLAYSLRVFFRDVLSEGSSIEIDSRTSAARRPALLPASVEGLFHLLVLIGTARSVWSGQSNAILVALVLLGAAAVVERQWWRAAMLLAAPIYIKIWPVAIAGLFGVQWPKRLAGRLTICTVGFGLLPFLTKPPAAVIASYSDWFHCLTNRQATQFRFPGYRDAWTIWEHFQSPVDKRAYLILQLGAGLATLGWCLWQSRRSGSVRWLAISTIAAWSAWQLLFGPGTERLTYNLIAPALAWAMLTSFQAQRSRAWITATYLTTYLLGIGGVERLLSGALPLATALEPIGVLMFAAWLVCHATAAEQPAEAPKKQAPTSFIPAIRQL
jgi:alpha-1,2-mannosyltransferase